MSKKEKENLTTSSEDTNSNKRMKRIYIIGAILGILAFLIGRSIGASSSSTDSTATTTVTAAVVEQTTTTTATTTTTVTTTKASETAGQRNCRRAAESYLSWSGMSYEGLKSQLEFDQYEPADIEYALSTVADTTDWNEEAYQSAKSYLEFSSFSKSELKEQLLFEKFTEEQATYGVEKAYQ